MSLLKDRHKDKVEFLIITGAMGLVVGIPFSLLGIYNAHETASKTHVDWMFYHHPEIMSALLVLGFMVAPWIGFLVGERI